MTPATPRHTRRLTAVLRSQDRVTPLTILIAYETVRFADLRDRLRHQLTGEAVAE